MPSITALAAELRRDLNPARLVPGVLAGTIIGVVNVIISLSYAALLFSQELSRYTGTSIALILFGCGMVILVVALFSCIPGMIAGVQDGAVAILGLVTIKTLLETTSTEHALITILATIAIATTATGLVFILIGQLKLGGLMRYFPYPVVGGVLAGSGWLLTTGSLNVLLNDQFKLYMLIHILHPALLIKWLPGVLLGIVMLIILRRSSHFLVMPGLLIGAAILFYVVLWLTGTDYAQASQLGLVVGALPTGNAWQSIPFNEIQHIDWPIVLRNASSLAAIVAISAIGMLLNATGIELAIGEDIDLDYEITVAGIGTLLGGLGGGLVGYHALSDTILVHRMNARSRLTGIIAAGVVFLALFFGASVLSYFPTPILGAVLLFLGLDLLYEWVIAARKQLPLMDYLVVLLILICVALFGFLEGVAVGVLAAVILFVVNYSRIDVIKHELNRTNRTSNVDRLDNQRHILQARGEEIYILELQGFIFFGTANRLLDMIRARLVAPGSPPPRFILLDFHRVTGLDSSAVSSFTRLGQLARKADIALVLTSLPEQSRRYLHEGGLCAEDGVLHYHPDLDRGLEWCENRLLASASLTFSGKAIPIQVRLTELSSGEVDPNRLLTYLERIETSPGQTLIEQGATTSGLYIIEDGIVTVELLPETGDAIRLRKMGAGSIIGEIGFYLHTTASASVSVEKAGVIYRLSPSALTRMEHADADLSAAFHKLMTRLVCERLITTNTTLQAMRN